jgi:hypothetical protein
MISSLDESYVVSHDLNESPAELVVNVLVPLKLKQYWVLAVSAVVGKVTVLPVTAVAVPIPGQGVEPAGKLVVVTVQLAGVESTTQSVPEGAVGNSTSK